MMWWGVCAWTRPVSLCRDCKYNFLTAGIWFLVRVCSGSVAVYLPSDPVIPHISVITLITLRQDILIPLCTHAAACACTVLALRFWMAHCKRGSPGDVCGPDFPAVLLLHALPWAHSCKVPSFWPYPSKALKGIVNIKHTNNSVIFRGDAHAFQVKCELEYLPGSVPDCLPSCRSSWQVCGLWPRTMT